jgi:hypothetical protein
MIVPPAGTPAFYTVLFEEPAAKKLAKLMSPSSVDVEQIIVTSLDLGSDIEATNELDAAVRSLFEGQKYDHTMKFNPIYLPIEGEELSTKLELDHDGDLTAIDGFASPYVSASIKLSIEDYPDVVDGAINFKQFELPTMRELIDHQVLIS